MAKTKISEYSSTATNNSDIGSVNIAEGCAPSGINNAIRILMSQLKNFQDGSAGDNVTVGGNLAVTGTSTLTGTLTATAGLSGPLTSSSATITGGTINGVVIGGSSAQAITGTTVTASTGFIGGLTGAVTGNTAGVHTGAVTGNVTGNLTGNVTGNVTAATGTSTFNNVTISGALDMDSGTAATITGLATPTNTSDAATKGYVDTATALKLNLTGGTLSGALAMGTNKITGLGTPTADADAVTKSYVDAIAQGIDAKASVVAATTANITLSAAQTIDGVSVIAGDRVLVKDQTTTANNGIYLCASGSWTRTTDADTYSELVAAYTFVEGGTVNANNGFICTIPTSGTLGSTSITFAQFSGAGQITAGAGLVKSGNTLNVQSASSSRILVGADEIDLASTGVSAGTYKSVTADVYGRITAGTNPTTISGFGITDAYTKTEVDTSLSGKLSTTGGTMSGAIAMGTSKITGLGDPTNNQDAATKTYVDGILGSATSAATSAAAAATSASNASTSASNASTSAGNASTSATNAAASATSASNTYDQFDDRYLGSKSSAPSVDNDGNALLTGALYWNTSTNTLFVWTGSTWTQAAFTASGFLSAANNLSDVSSTSTARTNLGLAIGTNVQAWDADLDTWSGKTAPSGTVVGTSDTQTLTNKTLTAPTIASANLTTALTVTGASGTSGQVLTSGGSGAAPTWTTISGGPSGITTTSPMSANITLTSSSTQVQNVAPDIYTRSVILPNATTITSPSGPVFIIKNISSVVNSASTPSNSYPVCVRRADNSLVTVINPNGQATISLVNNSTSRGEWSVDGDKLSSTFFTGNFTNSSSDYGRAPPVTLSNGNLIVAYQDTSSVNTNFVYVTKTGYANSYSAYGGILVGIYELNSTTVLFITYDDAGTLFTYAYSIGDTELTNLGVDNSQGMVSPYPSATTRISSAMLNSTTGVIAWSGTTTIEGIAFTVTSGGVVSFGSQQALKTGLAGTQYMSYQSLVAYSSTQIFAIFGTGATNPYSCIAFAMTVSGTTITAGASTTITTSTAAVSKVRCGMQNGLVLAMYSYNSLLYAAACSISGTTITAGSQVALTITTNLIDNPLRQHTYSTEYALYWPNQAQFNTYGACVRVQSNGTVSLAWQSTQASVAGVGIIKDTVNDRILGVNSTIPPYASSAGQVNSVGLRVYRATVSGLSSTGYLYDSGDLTGPVNTSVAAMACIGATSAGMVYSNTLANQRGAVLKTCSMDAVWSTPYGVAYSRLFAIGGSTDLASTLPNPLVDGFCVVRNTNNTMCVMEMAT